MSCDGQCEDDDRPGSEPLTMTAIQQLDAEPTQDRFVAQLFAGNFLPFAARVTVRDVG
ncbi:hypothetical protein [Chamaesiphon sp.]|uniref:hypothetical protein n=1 Tax=Chamaesiphon sp. TaxID=2814140 RepID=UPI0035936F3B